MNSESALTASLKPGNTMRAADINVGVLLLTVIGTSNSVTIMVFPFEGIVWFKNGCCKYDWLTRLASFVRHAFFKDFFLPYDVVLLLCVLSLLVGCRKFFII